ncbi:hypothetical protein [Endothiovibrio diazotrophicus]
MSWATVDDCNDGMVTVIQEDLDFALSWLQILLASKDIDPSEVPAGNQTLKSLQVVKALEAACLRDASGQDSPVLKKAPQYRQQADDMAALVSRKSLGLDQAASSSSSSFASIAIGRG